MKPPQPDLPPADRSASTNRLAERLAELETLAKAARAAAKKAKAAYKKARKEAKRAKKALKALRKEMAAAQAAERAEQALAPAPSGEKVPGKARRASPRSAPARGKGQTGVKRAASKATPADAARRRKPAVRKPRLAGRTSVPSSPATPPTTVQAAARVSHGSVAPAAIIAARSDALPPSPPDSSVAGQSASRDDVPVTSEQGESIP